MRGKAGMVGDGEPVPGGRAGVSVPLARKVPFWALLTAVSVLFVEVTTNSSPLAFFSAWGLLSVCPLYGLHVLVLARIAFFSSRVRLPLLFTAGAILGLYEAYITKVLWAPTWGPRLWTVGGVHVFQAAILILLAHPVLAFVLPLAFAERFFTASDEVERGVSPRIRRWLTGLRGTTRGLALVALYFGAYHGLTAPSAIVAFATAAANTAVTVLLAAWWRHLCSDGAPVLRDLLPDGRQFRVLLVLLAVYYGLSGALLRPEAMPRTVLPHVTILALYATLGAILARGILADRRRERVELPPVAWPRDLRPAWLLAAAFPLTSAAFAAAKPVAGVIVLASWPVGCGIGLALLWRALRDGSASVKPAA